MIVLGWLLCHAAFVHAIEAGSGTPPGQTGSRSWIELLLRQPSQWFEQGGLWLKLLGAFFLGMALNLTPCVYPMIPVTVAFFSSQAAGRGRRVIQLALLYVLGLSLQYALLGLLAARTGMLFGSWLQQPSVLFGIAVVIVALACSMFGLYELRLPHAVVQRFGRASSGRWGAFVMGMVVGVIAAPCVGPLVLSLLLVVSQLAHPLTGFLLFFALGLGMGLPYVFLALAARRVSRWPKAGPWLVWSKRVLGVVLLGLALYVLKPLLPARLLHVLVLGLLIGSGVYLGWLEPTRAHRSQLRWIRRVVGTGLIVAAIASSWPKPHPVPMVPWIPYSDAAFEHAQREQRPIVVDVYADWCLPCVEMDHVTFRHPEVVEAVAQVAMLRVDVTRGASDDVAAFLSHRKIYGAPTMLFIDRTGHERLDLRLTGFAGPEEFLERLQRMLEDSSQR